MKSPQAISQANIESVSNILETVSISKSGAHMKSALGICSWLKIQI